MKLEVRSLTEIRPYWRNPRLTDKAVEAVKASISLYGVQQPLVVDAEGVIVAGHTRYRAMLALGHTTAPCVVAENLTPQQVKEYRIADNKTGELAEWDMAALIPELREIGDLGDMTQFFPTVDLTTLLGEAAGTANIDVTQRAVEKVQAELDGRFQRDSADRKDAVLDVMCPECGHEFGVSRDQLGSYESIEAKVARERAEAANVPAIKAPKGKKAAKAAAGAEG